MKVFLNKIVIFLIISIFFIGCNKLEEINSELDDYINVTQLHEKSNDRKGDSKAMEQEEQREEIIQRKMDKEQEELLCRISVNDEKVHEGNLYDWQIEILNQYDFAMEYLIKKYPSHSFQIIDCVPKNKLNSYTTFTLVENTEIEKYYSLYLYVEQSSLGNIYKAKDNYYAALKEKEFAYKLFEMVQKDIPECIKVETTMSYVQGEEFGEDLNIEQILNGKIKLEQNTVFFIKDIGITEENFKQICKSLEDYIGQKEITGSFTIKLVEDEKSEQSLYQSYFFCN